MHDIDRIQQESDTEFEQWESGPTLDQAEAAPFQYESFEFGDAESALYGEAASVFGEADEMDLASELLGVGTEQELDQFLGNLIRRAGQAVGRVIRSPAGQAIGGLLKGAARQALPGIGSAVGGYFGGPTGARLGRQGASAAGRLFGLELEGLSGEDQEFEVARRFVRFSGDAVKRLAQSPAGRDVLGAARNAVIAAAQRQAPGLLEPRAPVSPPQKGPAMPGVAQSGRWMRRGNKIVLLGL
jgi:hypothetical protein